MVGRRLDGKPDYRYVYQQADSHLLLALRRYRLDKVGPDVLQAYYAAKLESGLSSTTVKYHHAIVHRALERAGLPPVRFHDLRHTSATLMVIAGVRLKQMGARLGHADIQTTAKYAHLSRGLDRDAAERLARANRAGEAEGIAAAQAYLKSLASRGRTGRSGAGGTRRRRGPNGGVARSRKGTHRGTGRGTARLGGPNSGYRSGPFLSGDSGRGERI
jgi:hypothetical protein